MIEVSSVVVVEEYLGCFRLCVLAVELQYSEVYKSRFPCALTQGIEEMVVINHHSGASDFA